MPGWMQRMLRRKNKRTGQTKRADNRGVSFVEVIVSMLIMAIAVIPLLGSFMLSLKVNLKSRQAMAATIVAQNVMECVKEYANSHTVLTGFDQDSEITKILPYTYVHTESGDTSFTPQTDGFTLSGVQEGVNDYFVRVTYSAAAFSNADNTGLNDQAIPDLTTLDADSTVIVCPSGVVNGVLENSARSYFLDEWVSRQWSSYSDTEGYTGPSEQERADALRDIEDKMTGQLDIEVSGTKTAPKVQVVLRYTYEGTSYSAYSYESSAGISQLENVYIFYDPLKISGDPSGTSRIEDMVQINNTGGFAWKLFFAVQESAQCLGSYSGSDLSGPVFAIEQTYIGEEIELFCSTKLEPNQRVSISGETLVPGAEKLKDKQSLVDTKDHMRMQKVTVQVYRQGEENTGSLLATMETDIMQ